MIRLHSAAVATLAVACLPALCAGQACAHAVAGARVFPVTLTLDDPGVADEASIPTFTYQRQGTQGGPGPTYQYNVSAEFDKRITEHLGIGFNDGYTIQSTAYDKTRTGFLDLVVTLKYQAWVNPPHELIFSLGVIREFGRTGTSHTGADESSNTTPTIYFGKGFGDLPTPALRPFAISGTAGYLIADKKLKASGASPSDLDANATAGLTGLQEQRFNNGYSNRWVGGVSLQYSFPYLQSQVRDIGLGRFFGRLTPLVELAYSSPASSPSNLGTQIVFAPGVIYQGDNFQFGVEALIPGNKASGTSVGVIAQFHVFFDDLFPNTLSKPLLSF